MIVEYFTSSFVYTLLKDGWRAFRGGKRKLSPSQIIELRQKWKPLFEAEVFKNYRENLRSDVIVRDMGRFDTYPEIKEGKGISPCFRVGLADTYHKGVLIGLRWGTLNKHDGGERWRFTNYAANEEGEISVLLVGSIPYENVENVDWEGDGFYNYPHLYCYFAYGGEPYEHLGFYTKTERADMPPFYTELASYGEVLRLSRKLGIKYFG